MFHIRKLQAVQQSNERNRGFYLIAGRRNQCLGRKHLSHHLPLKPWGYWDSPFVRPSCRQCDDSSGSRAEDLRKGLRIGNFPEHDGDSGGTYPGRVYGHAGGIAGPLPGYRRGPSFPGTVGVSLFPRPAGKVVRGSANMLRLPLS